MTALPSAAVTRDAELRSLADELQRAAHTRVPVPPPHQRPGELDTTEAYTVQRHQLAARTAAGARLVGHTVGITSAALRRRLGTDRPAHGFLLDTMRYDDGATLPADRFLAPRALPKLAFVLSRPLAGPGVDEQAAARAVGAVLPALEIIDSRVRMRHTSFADTVADNASAAAFVLGAGSGRPPAGLDLDECLAELEVNGELVAWGRGSDVTGTPLGVLAHLADTLAERGEALPAGHIVLAGALSGAVEVHAGDRLGVILPGIGSVWAHLGETAGLSA
ncbi:2-keto-4-pentenoate hydratase [Streptomyces sp. NPDC002577]